MTNEEFAVPLRNLAQVARTLEHQLRILQQSHVARRARLTRRLEDSIAEAERIAKRMEALATLTEVK